METVPGYTDRVYEFATADKHAHWFAQVMGIKHEAQRINDEARRNNAPRGSTSSWHNWLHVVAAFLSMYGRDFVPPDIQDAVTDTITHLNISRADFESHRFPGLVLVGGAGNACGGITAAGGNVEPDTAGESGGDATLNAADEAGNSAVTNSSGGDSSGGAVTRSNVRENAPTDGELNAGNEAGSDAVDA